MPKWVAQSAVEALIRGIEVTASGNCQLSQETCDKVRQALTWLPCPIHEKKERENND